MILDEIIAHKRTEIRKLAAVDRASLRDLPPCRGFRNALKREAGAAINVIAECKKGSPSKGIFVADYHPVITAFQYVLGGASAISVLTDAKFFHGGLADLDAVRQDVKLPLIRKDFTIDERQIAEARLHGADAILLIAAVLEDGQLRDLQGFARDLGLDVLVEVHDETEAMRAVAAAADPIGVNNRDLRDFSISLHTTMNLLTGIRDGRRVVVSESGIHHREHCHQLEEAGVDAVLVGEALMTAKDPSAELAKLRGKLVRALG